MPPLEDAFDDFKLIVDVPTHIEEIVIEVPYSYPLTDDKAVPWSYNMDVDLIIRFEHTYVETNAQPPKCITDEEANDFLVVIKQSEYKVVDQLRKLLAQISLLEFLQTSIKHQNALMKVSSEVHIPKMIEHDKLEEFVESILLKDQIAFSDDEFPIEGRGHVKTLYIFVKCKATHVA